MKNIYVCSACLSKKYCHRLRSLCEGKMCGGKAGRKHEQKLSYKSFALTVFIVPERQMFSNHVEGLLGKHSMAFQFRSFQPVDANRRSETGNIVFKYFTADTIVKHISMARKKKEKMKHLQNTRNNVCRSRSHQNIFTLVLIPPLIIESLESEGNNVPVKYKNSTRKA